jgi:hypothetical protein
MKTAIKKKMQKGGSSTGTGAARAASAISKAVLRPKKKSSINKMQDGGSNRDPLGGDKPNCKMGKCGPAASHSRGASRQKAASSRSFSKPKLKRTKVRF